MSLFTYWLQGLFKHLWLYNYIELDNSLKLL
jgi:hypothetical protein